jgi:hypothetical protein
LSEQHSVYAALPPLALDFGGGGVDVAYI